MMYRYQNEAIPEEEGDLRIATGRHQGGGGGRQSDHAKIGFMKHDLNMSLDDLESAETSSGATGLSAAIGKVRMAPEKYRIDTGTKEKFSAEVFLSWRGLGFTEKPGGLKADFGILSADTGGEVVEYRTQWANTKTDHCSDLGVEAQINPRSWGKVGVGR